MSRQARPSAVLLARKKAIIGQLRLTMLEIEHLMQSLEDSDADSGHVRTAQMITTQMLQVTLAISEASFAGNERKT